MAGYSVIKMADVISFFLLLLLLLLLLLVTIIISHSPYYVPRCGLLLPTQ